MSHVDASGDHLNESSPNRALRKPHGTGELCNGNEIPVTTSSTKLNVGAAVFVPGSRPFTQSSLNAYSSEFIPSTAAYTQSYPTTDNYYDFAENSEPIYEYLDYYRLTVDRPEHLLVNDTDTAFVNPAAPDAASFGHSSSTPDNVDENVVNQFKEILFVVTSRPGIVDDSRYLASYLHQFSTFINSDGTLQAIVSLIIEQGIAEPNFRYSGARICSCFIDVIQLAGFRKYLLIRLKAEYVDEKLHDVVRKQGYVMFIAELFLHLKMANGTPYFILRKVIFDVVSQLLDVASNDTIKCVCQLLKLAGALIDESVPYVKSEDLVKQNFEMVYSQLNNLSTTNIHPNYRALIESVLRQHHARMQPVPSPEHYPDHNYTPAFPNEPVFYGGSGVISRQQAGFEDATSSDYEAGGVNEPVWSQLQSLHLDSGMDPEMEEAYEQFLREQEQCAPSK